MNSRASRFEIPGDSERLLDVATRARLTGRILIQRRGRVLISPRLLPGWHRVGVCTRNPKGGNDA